jgi:hypothetical protein
MHKGTKSGLAALAVLILTVTPVSAHFEGAFKDWLAKNEKDFSAGLEDESTTKALRQEIAQTQAEMQKLAPQVQAMEGEYRKKEKAELSKVQFYSYMGFDLFANYLLQTKDVADLLSTQKILEDKLSRDLDGFDRFFQDFRRLQASQQSLENYGRILQMISHHLDAREKFMAANKGKSKDELQKTVNLMWLNQQTFLKVNMETDATMLQEHTSDFVTRSNASAPYRLEGERLNQRSRLQYLFQPDHLYMHFAREDVDFILIGQVVRRDPQTIGLELEGGFINGILLPPALLGQLKGFTIPYKNIDAQSKTFYVEQMNGSLAIQPVENVRE